MFNATHWLDHFGDQVSKQREALTGRITLLHDAEVEAMPGMEEALFQCYVERVKPKVAAQRYLRLRGEL